MALLSTEDQLKYRLAHGKMYLASCDGPCQKLIPASDLFIVKEWRARKDKLLFLGAIPTDIRCMTCYGIAQGTIKVVDGLPTEPKPVTAKIKIKKRDMIAPVRRAILAIFVKEPTKKGYTTAEIILKLRRRAALREYGKGEMRKTLSQMKRFRDLRKTGDNWLIRKKEQHA